MRGNVRRQRMTPGAIAVRIVRVWFILAFILFPNINIIINVLQEDGRFSTEAVTKLLKSKRAVKSMVNSLILGVSLAVSYTHLDVYKRQEHQRYERAGGPPAPGVHPADAPPGAQKGSGGRCV